MFEAFEIFESAANLLQQKSLSPILRSSASLACALHYQGIISYLLGEYKESKAYLNRALEALTSSDAFGYGDDQFVDVGGILNDLALVCLRLGEYDKSEATLKRCQYLAERAYKPNTVLLALTYFNRAELAWIMGDTQRALLYQGNVSIFLSAQFTHNTENGLSLLKTANKSQVLCDILGIDLEIIARVNNVKLFIKLMDYDRAHKELNLIEVFENSLKPSVFGELLLWGKFYNCKSILCALNGQIEAALNCCEQSLECLKDAYVADHPDKLVAMHNMAIFSPTEELAIERLVLVEASFARIDTRCAAVARHNVKCLDSDSETVEKLDPLADAVQMSEGLKIFQLHHYGGAFGALISKRPSDFSFAGKRMRSS